MFVVAGAALAVVLLTPTVIGGWAPILHWTCEPSAELADFTNYFIPAVLVNSPYGGNANGSGIFPPTFPGVTNGPPGDVKAIGFGTGASNGDAFAALFTVDAGIYDLSNETQWGSGSNVRCHQKAGVFLAPPSLYVEVGGEILGGNNTSDVDEPSRASLPAANQADNVTFNNSFDAANIAAVSTCGRSALVVPNVSSNRLTVWFPLTVGGRDVNVRYVIPVHEVYAYSFPANFGTWQIQNLSAPGGPGGGWAFSYSPCP